jgi:hypothetical protein
MTSRRESDSGDLPGTDLIAEDAEAGSAMNFFMALFLD